MGIVPNYPQQVGVLTADYIGTHFDKVIALADRKEALDALHTNMESLLLVYATVDDVIASATVVNDAIPELEAIHAAVSAAQATAVSALNSVTTLFEATRTYSNDAEGYSVDALRYKNDVQALKTAMDSLADTITTVVTQAQINTVNLSLGDRLDSTATLTYGGRV